MTQQVYFDCDNTMGLAGCDLDDGLALLYLMGRDDVRIEALTTSFGNSAIDRVHANTERMFHELHLEQIPLKKGAASPQQRQSPASRYLASEIPRRGEKVKLLITGSPTNIYAACLENEGILDSIEEMIFMGGILHPLIIGGKVMRELNFSSDPQAIRYLLNCPIKKTVMTAQICLDAFFDRPKLEYVLSHQQYPAFAYMAEAVQQWYRYITGQYGVPGFHLWDIVAAVYITTPELFDQNDVDISSTVTDLKKGMLKIDLEQTVRTVNLPKKIQNIVDFWQIVFTAWENVHIS